MDKLQDQINVAASAFGDANFKDLFESLSLMFYIECFEGEYKMEYLSPEFECLGYTLEEIYSNPAIIRDSMHPEDLKMMNEANKVIYNRTKVESDYEYRMFTKSGEVRWWKDRGRAVFNEKGERIKWFGVIYDVTDRKNAEENLLESRNDVLKNAEELAVSYETTEAILESICDLLLVVNDEGIIIRVNETATAMTGYSAKELIGQHVRLLTRTESFFAENQYQQLVKVGKLLNIERNFVCKDDSIIPVSISISVRKDHKNGAVIVAKDISTQIEAEQNLKSYADRLENSNRELEDFAYVASHDLQEPLRKIQAFGDRLIKKFSDVLPDEGKDYVGRMHSAADRMHTLINDLLTFSRVSTKVQPFREVEVTKVANEVVSDLEIRIEQTGGTVEIENLPNISADPLQMRQLFQNLIGNALKFHRPDVPPRIRVYSKLVDELSENIDVNETNEFRNDGGKKFCRIIVHDNGVGFDEKYLDRIFTVFQRLHGREKFEGSGIGLSICRKIVERHGGEITAQSSPETGSKFIVTLPINHS